MKKTTILIFCILLLNFPIFAQAPTFGKVVYEEVTKFSFDFKGVEGAKMQALKEKMPTSRTLKKELFFKDGEAFYQNVPEKEGEENSQEAGFTTQTAEGNVVKVQMVRPENTVYYNFQENLLIEQREFMTRQFLIEEDKQELLWKLGAEQKEILGFKCQKAMLADTSQKIVAWFTPQIPVSLGPETYRGLPGLILEIESDEGKKVLRAVAMDFQNQPEEEISTPEKGKKISREEFEKVRAEKIEEMKKNYGGKGKMIFIKKN